MNMEKICCNPLDLHTKTCEKCPDFPHHTEKIKKEIKEILESQRNNKKQKNPRTKDKWDNL